MRQFFKYAAIVLGVSSIFYIQIILSNLLPYLFTRIDIIFLIVTWLAVLIGNEKIIWAAIPLGFLLELTSVLPYGVIGVSFFFGILTISWLLLNFFTNRSVYIVFFVCFLGMLVYRLNAVVLNVVFNLGNNINEVVIFDLLDPILNSFLTSLSLALIYLITSFYIKRLNPQYIHLNKL